MIDVSVPETGIDEAQQDLIDDFAFFDDWLDRYQYLIDQGRQLPPFPPEWQREENKLQGCQSQVWLVGEWRDGRLRMAAVSDAAIVSGLIALLMRIYNGRTADEINSTPPAFIEAIGLDSHLSPTRSNGLNAMLQAIFAMASAHVGRGVTSGEAA